MKRGAASRPDLRSFTHPLPSFHPKTSGVKVSCINLFPSIVLYGSVFPFPQDRFPSLK